jgi:hypothetical protein
LEGFQYWRDETELREMNGRTCSARQLNQLRWYKVVLREKSQTGARRKLHQHRNYRKRSGA